METQTLQPAGAPLAASALTAETTTTSLIPVSLYPPYMAPAWAEHFVPPRTDVFWYAKNWNPSRGEIVMQLGTRPTPANGMFYSTEYRLGFTYRFTASRDGYHEFKAFIKAGPVTVNHGTGAVYSYLDVRKQGDRTPVSTPALSRIPSSAPQYYELTIGEDLYAGQAFSFTMNGRIIMYMFGGGNAYSEIIAGFTKAELRRPRLIIDPVEPALGFAASEPARNDGEQDLQARLDEALRRHGSLEKALESLGLEAEAGEPQVFEREVSLEETLEGGPNGLWEFKA